MHASIVHNVASILESACTVDTFGVDMRNAALRYAANAVRDVRHVNYAARVAASLAHLATVAPTVYRDVQTYLIEEREVAASMERFEDRRSERAEAAFREGLPRQYRNGKSARSIVREFAKSPALDYVTGSESDLRSDTRDARNRMSERSERIARRALAS